MTGSWRRTARFCGSKLPQRRVLDSAALTPCTLAAMRLFHTCVANQLMGDVQSPAWFDSMPFGLVSFERATVDSSIQVGVRGPTVWVKVEGKGSFLNSGNLKEFAREMLDRGFREFFMALA